MMSKIKVEWLVVRVMIFIHDVSLFDDMRRLFCKEESFVVMVFVVSPAGLILNVVCLNNYWVQWVAHLVGNLHTSFDFIVGMLLLIFLFECAAQVFLKLFLRGMEAIVRLKVREGFMKLTHEDLIVGFAEV